MILIFRSKGQMESKLGAPLAIRLKQKALSSTIFSGGGGGGFNRTERQREIKKSFFFCYIFFIASRMCGCAFSNAPNDPEGKRKDQEIKREMDRYRSLEESEIKLLLLGKEIGKEKKRKQKLIISIEEEFLNLVNIYK